ncbi:MAG: hypothetical protein ACO3HT_09015 [Ilumatobacteraceae bacterium]
MKYRATFASVWALALLGSACSANDGNAVSTASVGSTVTDEQVTSTSPPPGSEDDSPETSASNESPESLPISYDWSAPLIGGGSVDLAGYSNSAVVLWFWAPY